MFNEHVAEMTRCLPNRNGVYEYETQFNLKCACETKHINLIITVLV